MARNQKPIAHYMSRAPVCAQLDILLAEAVQLMAKHGIRHLPVLDGVKVVGVVSERDLAIAESLVPETWESFPLAEAMTPEPYCVSPETPLCEVAAVMADNKYGCALVIGSNGEIAGLFSTVDALRVLAMDPVD
jgi:acetoin utilization protein AcuB